MSDWRDDLPPIPSDEIRRGVSSAREVAGASVAGSVGVPCS